MGRYFAGIRIPGTQAEKLARLAAALQPVVTAKRWYGAEQFHITTNFLGELDASQVEQARRVLNETVPQHKRFQLSLEAPGAFPHARVVWCGVGGEVEKLERLQQQLRKAYAELGAEKFQRERYIPHITLARTGDIRNFQADQVEAEAKEILQQSEWRVESVCLFESVLGPGGAKYPVVHEVKLEGRHP